MITVYFSTNEAVTTPTVTIGGKSATVSNVSGNNYKATYTVLAGDSGATAVVVNATDLAGNLGTGNLASNVTIDSTPPAVTFTSELSNNAINTLAKAGDVITVLFSSSEALSATPTVTIGGKSASSVTNLGGNSYKATYSVVAGDSGATAVVVNATDLAGNSGPGNLASNVTMDTTAPLPATLALAADTGTNNSDGITNNGTINVTASADTVKWEYSTNSGTSWAAGTGTSFNLPAGSYTTGQVKVRASDAAGNVSTLTSFATAVTVDTTGPVAATLALATDTGRDNSDGITSNGQINVTTSGADTASWQYSTNGGTSWTTGSGTSFVAPEGTYTANQIQVKAFDNVGNSTVSNFAGLTVAKSMSEVVSMKVGGPVVDLYFDSSHNFDETYWQFGGDPSTEPFTAKVNGASLDVLGVGYDVSNGQTSAMWVQLATWSLAPTDVITLSYVDPNPGVPDSGDVILKDVAGNESPSFNVIIGGTNNDNLVGGTNTNNFFFGGAGNDTMTGSTANDTYIWQKGDAGTSGSTGTVTDTIKNFSSWNAATGTGDKLNIAALLDHTTYTSLTGSGFFPLIQTGQTVNGVANSTVITLDTNGNTPGGPTQKIVLEGINLLTQNNITMSNYDQMVTQLISKGVLIA